MAKKDKLTFKELKDSQKQEYKDDISTARREVEMNALHKLSLYKSSKKLRWYDFLTILVISSFLIGMSFVFGSVVMKNNERVEWFMAGFTIFTFLVYWILGWYKNRQAAKFYNSSVMRYQRTLTEFEGSIKRYKAITLIITLILFISSLIILFTYNV